MNNYIRILAILMFFVVSGCESKQQVAIPLEYLSIDQKIRVVNKTELRISQKEKLCFPAGSGEHRIYKLPTSNGHVLKYHTVKAFWFDAQEKSRPIEIRYEKLRRKDLDNESYVMQTPYFVVPETDANGHVEIEYEMSFMRSSSISVLPEQSIKEVRLTVETESVYFNIQNIGFEEETATSELVGAKRVFVLKNKSPINEFEKNLPSPTLLVSTLNSWKDDADGVISSYKNNPALENLELKGIAQAILQSVPSGISNRERTLFLLSKSYDFIANNYRYKVAPINRNNGLTPRELAQILKTKVGDCKDFAALYIALLGYFNIDAEPVFIVVGDKSLLQADAEIPTSAIFDHVIVHVPSLNYYVDPTAGKNTYVSIMQGANNGKKAWHVFSGEYKEITSNFKNYKKAVAIIANKSGQWKARMEWLAYEKSQFDVNSMVNSIKAKLDSNGSLPMLVQNNAMFDASSLMVQHDKEEGLIRVNFSYDLQDQLTNTDGSLKQYPFVFNHLIVPEFYLHREGMWWDSRCISNSISEEEILIEDVLVNTKTAKNTEDVVNGTFRTFTQKISFLPNAIKITRKLEINDRRNFCPGNAEALNVFHGKINKLKNSVLSIINTQSNANHSTN